MGKIFPIGQLVRMSYTVSQVGENPPHWKDSQNELGQGPDKRKMLPKAPKPVREDVPITCKSHPVWAVNAFDGPCVIICITQYFCGRNLSG